MTTLEILEAARDLIREPENWCQHRVRNWAGAHCAFGAIMTSVRHQYEEGLPALAALGATLPMGYSGGIGDYNDTHTHAEVLELFNLAIAAELSKQYESEPVLGEPVLLGAC